MLKAISLALVLVSLVGCVSSNVRIVEDFRDTRKSGDLDAARAYLVDDPRVWYGEKDGEGSPWKLGGGRWKQWDEHFRSESNPGPWHTQDGTVWRVVEESNDYFRLIERQDTSRYRITYFFKDDGRIEGYMISATDPDAPPKPSVSRFDEVEAWAKEHHPEEWDYLRPGGSLDPTGDRAERTRKLINEWRDSVGLQLID